MRNPLIEITLLGCALCAATAHAVETNTLDIRLDEAVLMALTNNRALRVQQLSTDIQRTYEQVERAAFDPLLSGDIHTGRDRQDNPSASSNASDAVTFERAGGSLGLTEKLPSGTQLGAGLNTEYNEAKPAGQQYAARAEIGATQPLLQGRPVAVNLVRLRQARLDTEISEYELRGFIETLVAAVESAYWECALAERRVQIYEKSMALAQEQLSQIEHRIRVGDLPETELAAAQAEVALRNESLINARSTLDSARLRMVRLIAPEILAGPRRSLALLTQPAVPEAALNEVTTHVAIALEQRPDLNEARLRLRQNELELVRTRNGLLPKLDFFIQLGATGYADSFGDSASDLDGDRYDLTAGIKLEFPLLNRAEKARHERALLSREQATEALDNLSDLARVDLESAYIEVNRTRAQVDATATTRKLQEEKVRAETAKFQVGRSTSLLVSQAQRDLVESQVSEAAAVIRHLEALVNFFRQEGTLLERRGLVTPVQPDDD